MYIGLWESIPSVILTHKGEECHREKKQSIDSTNGNKLLCAKLFQCLEFIFF